MSTKSKSVSDENILQILLSRFLPYWPLFAFLILASLILAWVHLKTTTPIYEATATLIIKDKNKGVDDAKVMESMNPFDTKKIVENEIEIIRSRALMNEVVNNLSLYAPVFEDNTFSTKDAYLDSPVVIKLKNPENITLPKVDGPFKFSFKYNNSKKTIEADAKIYPINEWVRYPGVGELKFELNKYQNEFSNSNLYFTIIPTKNITRNLLKNLSVEATNKLSTVVTLVYRDAFPQRGEDVLNSLITAYNQKAIKDRNALAESTLTFIEERMKNVERELGELEMGIQQFRSAEGVVDLSEQGKLYLKDAGDYDRQIADINRQLAVLRRIENYVIAKNNQGGLVPSTQGINAPVLTQLLQKLYNSELEYEKLKKTTAENNPILVSVVNEINKIRPSILENISSQRNNLQASLGNLNYNSDRSNLALKNIPEKEREFLEVSRRKAIKNELFSFLQQKREETALSYAPDSGDSTVVDLAESSYSPVSPNSRIIYLLAFVIACAIGIGYVVLKEILNSKVLFRSEIESSTNFPVVAELPHIKFINNEDQNKSIQQLFLNWFHQMSINLGLKGSNSLKGKEDQIKTRPREALLLDHFRRLSATLGLYDRSFNKKKILVTSSISDEGKSFVSTNLAYCLAQSGKRVVLIDMDFLKPQTSEFFDLSKANGLINYLNSEISYEDALTRSPENKNLYILPVGKQIEDHTKLLLNGKIDTLFETLSTIFDYIIIDSAPINLVADVNLLAQYSDKTLFVIRHARTPKQVISHLDHSNSLSVLKEVSIVFNDIRKRGMLKDDMGYGYGYSYRPTEDYEYSAKL